MLFFMAISFVSVLRSDSISDNTTRKFNIAIVVLVSFTLVLTTLQIYVNRPLFRGIKSFGYVIVFLISGAYLNILFFKRLVTLAKDHPLIRRTRNFMICLNLFTVLIIAYNIYSGVSAEEHLGVNTLNPTLDGDKIVFPVAQFVAVFIAELFMCTFCQKKGLSLAQNSSV